MYTIKLMLNAILFEWRSRRGFMNLLSLFRIAGALAVYLRFQYFATEHWNAIYPVWLGYFLYSWVVLLFVLLHNRDLHFSPTAHYVYYLLLIGVDVFVISYFLNATFMPPVEDTNSELYLFYLLPLITTAFYIQRSDAALGISAAIVLTYFLTLRGMSPDKPHLFDVWAARAFILLVATWFVRVLVKFHHLHEERVTSPTSVRNELEEMLKELQQSVAYDTISVQILYRTHLQIVCCLGFENPKDIYQIEFPSDDKKYPNHLVISSKRCIVADPKDYPSFHESQYFADHIATWMGVPLISPDTGECFGLISIDSQTPNAYSKLDQSKAQWFSAKVSSFLVAAGLGPAALTQSTKRENLLELLRQWAQLLPRKTSDWEDDSQAANFLANFGKDLFHVEDCSIYFLRHRFDELGDKIRVLHLIASSTIPLEVFSKNESLVTGHQGDGLTGLAVHRNKTLNLGTNQIKRSPYRGKFTDHLQYLFSKSSRQIMIVPLRDARGRAKGAIKIENRMGRTSAQPFSPVEEHTFEIFAAMVSLLLENTRQRNFIERQMQSIHSLRGIMPHGIAPLEELLQDTNHHKRINRAAYPKKLGDALNTFVYSKSVLDSILAESGETLLLENEGLIPALYHFIDSLKSMPLFGPSCERITFQLDDAREYLPVRARVAFYNVAREAILNLVRHAGIDLMENGMGLVKFYVDGDTYHLVIQDNGKGFDLSEKLSSLHSFGLIDMMEFQQNIMRKLCKDANLILTTEPGKGTLIHLSATL
jgi:putative methionine-R-sulfoxide reductase with GAF domain